MDNTPTPEQVKNIFKDTYLLFIKYKDSNNDSDYQAFIKESHDLEKKYPFDLCKNQLIDIACILDGYYKKRSHGKT